MRTLEIPDSLSDEEFEDIKSHVRGMSETPREKSDSHDWHCFHCGRTFYTILGASLHFGVRPHGRLPSCRFDPILDVESFHRKFGIHYNGKPRALDFETLNFRLRFMREEMKEYEDHMSACLFELDKKTRTQTEELSFDNTNFVYHLAAALDALADLIYVVFGTSHLHGFDMRTAFERVHKANMKKERSQNASDSESKFKFKMVKPPGWESPRHEDLVEDHAHLEKS